MKKDYEYLTRLKMAWRHITARFLNSAAMNWVCVLWDSQPHPHKTDAVITPATVPDQ
jgi:hypothetical protein